MPTRWPTPACPVSDLVARMGYKTDSYRKIFSDIIGKDANDNVKEYMKRSPYTYAAKLNTPLLIHSNTNDEDVNVLEVRAPDRRAESRRQEVRIQDLRRRPRRPSLQPPGYQAGA